MEFEKVIVHVLDCEHNLCIPSVSCMEEMAEESEAMLLAKTEKIFKSMNKKSGSFQERSRMKQMIEDYLAGKSSFEACSEAIARDVFEKKMNYALYQSADLVIAQLIRDGRRYLLGLENSYMKGITHNLIQQEEGVRNEIIPYHTLLSANLVKKDRAFLIELSDLSLHCVEQPVEIEGEKAFFFADVLLESRTAPSYKEAVTNISRVTEEMSEKYHLDEVELLPRMKSVLADSVEQQTPICLEDMADILFKEAPMIQEDFKEELKKRGVHQDIPVEHGRIAKAEKVQKIKTDKGIELIIPIDYMNSKEFVEFKNNPDGTISIQLKNITHLSSR